MKIDTMPTPVKQRENEFTGSQGFGTQIPFESINEPGCYICNWSGHLLRVPEDAIKPGRSPVSNLSGIEALFVTKIHSDPFVPVTKARMLAADCDVVVNF